MARETGLSTVESWRDFHYKMMINAMWQDNNYLSSIHEEEYKRLRQEIYELKLRQHNCILSYNPLEEGYPV
jgi:hypothetical protein